jgi:hypothetical protein
MIKDERLSHTKEIEPKREKSNPQYCGVFAVLALSRGQALRLDSRALPRRHRTLKRDEHGARFFLHQEMRRLACVPTKDENRDLESRTDIRENGTTDGLASSAATPRD